MEEPRIPPGPLTQTTFPSAGAQTPPYFSDCQYLRTATTLPLSLSAASRRGLFVPLANSACVLIRLTKRFRASLPDAYAWCTEFRDSDPELSRVRLRTRKVIRREGDVIEMEETGIMGFPFIARYLVRLLPPDGWDADAHSNMGQTHNTYRLFSDTDGTRLEMTFDVHLRGLTACSRPSREGSSSGRPRGSGTITCVQCSRVDSSEPESVCSLAHFDLIRIRS